MTPTNNSAARATGWLAVDISERVCTSPRQTADLGEIVNIFPGSHHLGPWYPGPDPVLTRHESPVTRHGSRSHVSLSDRVNTLATANGILRPRTSGELTHSQYSDRGRDTVQVVRFVRWKLEYRQALTGREIFRNSRERFVQPSVRHNPCSGYASAGATYQAAAA
jgi:hypothetical protein